MLFSFLNALRDPNVGPLGATVFLTGYVLAIVLGITLHEFAHALVAYRLGDLTPLNQGRVTINPLAHFDVYGTLMIVLVGFGYGRPVETHPYNYRMDQRTGSALVAIAGPITNFIIAVVFGLALRILIAGVDPAQESFAIVIAIFSTIVRVNLLLAIFNLVPFPPLDGSKILLVLLPRDMAYRVERFYMETARYGFIILFLLLYVGGQFFGSIFNGPVSLLYSLIVGN